MLSRVLPFKRACFGTAQPFLAGVRVLDLSRIIVGPYASMILSDFGAEVIKVQHPEGDQTRKWGPPWKDGTSCYFLCINRNKKSINVDLKKPQAAEVIYRLAASSQVVIQNFVPGTTERLKVDFDSISKVNPTVVYCSISGYGDTGPKAHQPAFDQVVQGQAGFMHLTGGPQTDPFKMGFAIADVLTGLHASTAILGALNYVKEHKKAIHVQTSLIEASVSSLINQASNYLNGQANPQRMGNNHPNIVPYGVFKCLDGYITVAGGTDKQYDILCKALAINSPKQYTSNKKRVENRDAVNKLIETETMKWNSKELLEKLARDKVPSGPINSLQGVFEDEQIKHLKMVHDVSKNDKNYRLIRSPIRSNEDNIIAPSAPPENGEHTDEILKSVGYTESQRAHLRKIKVVEKLL